MYQRKDSAGQSSYYGRSSIKLDKKQAQESE